MTSDFLIDQGGPQPKTAAVPREITQRVAEIEAESPGLLDGPCADLRRAALTVAVAGLRAADPAEATRRAVSYSSSSDTVRVAQTAYQLTPESRVWVLGAGKASYPVAVALQEVLGDRIAGGVVAVRDPAAPWLQHVEVICTDHPLPSPRSAEAASKILAIAREAGPGDLVLACFTGGSSALAALPPPGVSVDDKRTLHQLLLSSGLAITEINVVRKQVSSVKGGRVALAAWPATVVNLTVSDVAGSPLDTVTDPTVQDTSSAAQARSVLECSGLWDAIPPSVRAHLESDVATPSLADDPQTVMLADGLSTVAVMVEAASALGFRAVSVSDEVEGSADDIGPMLVHQLIGQLARSGDTPEKDDWKVMLLGCGGESVVTVETPGAFSLGGPNQHAGLRAATVLHGRRAAALFIDTDGSDGGTDLAGALIDGTTLDLADARGIDVMAALVEQRSTDACLALDAAVRTGHTGTNVNDLFVLVAEPGVVP